MQFKKCYNLSDPCPSELLVNLINTAKDIYPKVSGVYTKQSELSNEMPYWKNDDDQVLYFRRGHWKMGTLDQLGTKFEAIQSLEAGICPNSLSAKWMYLDEDKDWQYEYDVELYSGKRYYCSFLAVSSFSKCLNCAMIGRHNLLSNL